MAKDTFFFRHDYEPTTDPKIQAMLSEHGATGYGLFWRIIEMLHSEALHKIPKKKYFYMAIAKQMEADVNHVEAFVKSCIELYELFESDDNYFWSNRVIRNIEYKDSMSQKRSDAGKRSADIKKQNKASVQQVLTSVQQKSTYNIKEDNIILDKTKTDNSIEAKKKIFANSLKPFVEKYGKEMIREFYDYWTEPTESGKSYRRLGQKYFDTNRRLANWKKGDRPNNFISKGEETKIFEPGLKRLG